MNLLVARRAAITCAALWSLLVAVYLTLGIVEHAVLPAPYNVLLMATLALATFSAGGAWFVARIEADLAAQCVKQDHREGRIYIQIVRIRERLDDLEVSTADLHPRLVAVGTATVAPTPADVLEIGRRIVRKLEGRRYEDG